ncbi:MAG: efflux RND transporter periplasmic adaptor subunit [Butyrivibrio sp.]|uniref:efflux RND transporter periplasmic adaptor subunit n=1 Tax=Butyrivibrio sp. TaxID=28121 RepID=UPI001B0D140D|nr:efflux RND transporter periplasmic adaptor subunit [Butyrivibrio sp.]MBO6242927.1 efflux RND transporter periplasmic adaptor subunit [Butyrivibrio sp.]
MSDNMKDKKLEENKDLNTKETENKETTVNTEIKETTGSETEVYDDYEEATLPDEVTGKKKFKLKKRYVVGGIVALLVLGAVGRSIIAGKNQVTMVQTTPVALGSIENVLSISGTVQSAETKTFFSEVAAPVETLDIKVGDKVSAGDVLYSYDAEALDRAQKTAELAITQAKGSYSSLYSEVGAADRKYAEGMTAQQINDRLDAITAEIDALNTKITEKTNRINQTLKDLQNVALDINQNGIADSSEGLFDNGSDSYIYRNENNTKDDDGNYTEPTEENKQASLAIQQTINDVTYALKSDAEIQSWNDQITALKEEQSHLSSAKAAQINGGTAVSSKAQYESTQITQEDTIEKIENAKEGVKAEFNGVVTEVAVVEGATVTAGTKMVTMANLDDVQVALSVSKSDLPKIALGQNVDITINGKAYSGEVTKISGNATKNSNGVAVVETIIQVTNPDSDIILGVEATNKIHAEKADNTIVLPYEYVQTDADGDYVYVVENGLVTRKNVTVGISTSTDAQIVEGLAEGDEVITSDATLLTEGMPVAVNNM